MILVLSEASDPHAARVTDLFRQRGVSFQQYAHPSFPCESTLAIAVASGTQSESIVNVSGQTLSSQDISSIWYRRPEKPVLKETGLSGAVESLAADECKAFLRDFWATFDCHWFPAKYADIQSAGLKGAQLVLAQRLGFELPPTLITNDPDRILEFFEAHSGRAISKAVSKLPSERFATVGGRYTEPITHGDLSNIHAAQYCPTIFQAYVPKRVELRITVVGSTVFPAEIHSQLTHHTSFDWRHYDFGRTPHLVHRLPEPIADKCRELTRRLRLEFAAIDMILTPDGRYVFVELNPNGQYLWIEEETGMPISESICDLLQSHERGHSRHG